MADKIYQVTNLNEELIKKTITLEGGYYSGGSLIEDEDFTSVYIGYPESSETQQDTEGWAIRKLVIRESLIGTVVKTEISESWLNNDTRKIYTFTGGNINF